MDAPVRDVSSLRRENEALRRANAHLKDRLDSLNENQQDIIDHYERLLAEITRQDAVGTTPRGRTTRPRNSQSRSMRRRKLAAVRSAVRTVATRVVRTVRRA
ncbi:hypothetical protein [Haloferax sp. CBA1150]|uniref:hypothetical protein n=1 Tax=Haloferax sp. CBA1150 TaxID=2650754 RepID=UPI001CD9D10F|nr:hypothetical protein [Haloferax sp. CBA1150]